MMIPGAAEPETPVEAFGPELPGFGSWEWVGADIAEELSVYFKTLVFRDTVPECDVVVFVKFKPAIEVLEQISQRAAVVYAPVDCYGSAAEIDSDYRSLQCCDLILLHCERLFRYFSAYAPVEYIDHHLKFHAPLREAFLAEGPLLWVGVRSNLPPLVEWVNRNRRRLPGELWLLTNPENEKQPPDPREYGFQTCSGIRMDVWNATRQREWIGQARAALDIKGDDFRSRRKPPAKALDFIASGVPPAMTAGSSAAQHLTDRGFQLANVADPDRWFSRDYWEETVKFGRSLQSELSRRLIGLRWRRLLEGVMWREAGRLSS